MTGHVSVKPQSARRRLKVAVILLALVAVVFWLARCGARFVEVDKCLDRGGAFDYQSGTCDYGEGGR
jgi:hypothetical protein